MRETRFNHTPDGRRQPVLRGSTSLPSSSCIRIGVFGFQGRRIPLFLLLFNQAQLERNQIK